MSLFNQLVVLGLPLIPKPLVREFSRRYVAGDKLEHALGVVRRMNDEGMRCTIDLLGEFVHTKEQALAAAEEYKDILASIHLEKLDANISVKPTQMGLLLDKELCFEIYRDLAKTAKSYGNFVRVEMEDTPCTDDTIDLYLRLRKQYKNAGLVLQAYLRRTLSDARRVMNAKAGHFRLCKGIYVEPRELAYKDPDIINRNYIYVLEEMIKSGAFVGIATHDEKLVWEAFRLIEKYQLSPSEYEFQMLLGVDAQLRRLIVQAGHPLRVYVPYGKHWYAYSIRRLRENPSIARHVLKNFFGNNDDGGVERRLNP